MPVITRKEGEAFQIGPDIWVTVVRIRGSAIQIGIDAPRSLKILRDDHAEFVVRHSMEETSDVRT